MLHIKVLNKKNHPFTHKIKVYGISIEAILITCFILIVIFVAAVYLAPGHKKEKEIIRHENINR